MREINAVVYLPDQMADWEVGYATGELGSGESLKPDLKVSLTYAGETAEPSKTIGQLTVSPDQVLDSLDEEAIDLLILPGAETWVDASRNVAVLDLAARLVERGVPIAAICGATFALGRVGLLNSIRHTSNAAMFLASQPAYTGHELYREQPAVNDSGVITAGSFAGVEFAYEIFKQLNLMDPEVLRHWYRYWGEHNPAAFSDLISAHAATAEEGARS